MKIEISKKTVFPNTHTHNQTKMEDLTQEEKNAIDVLYRGMCKRRGFVVKDDTGNILDTDAKISAELTKVMAKPVPKPEPKPVTPEPAE